MKKIITTISAIMIISSPLWAAEGTQKSHDMMHHDMMSGMQMHYMQIWSRHKIRAPHSSCLHPCAPINWP